MLVNINFWLVKMFYPKKRLARKSCYNEKIWIFSIRQIIKSTNWHCKKRKQHQKLEKDYKFNENWKIANYNKSDLIYNTVHSFYKYNGIKKFNKFSTESEQPISMTF